MPDLESLFRSLNCRKPPGWSTVWRVNQISIRPPCRSIGKFTIDVGTSSDFHLAFFDREKNHWDQRFELADSENIVDDVFGIMERIAEPLTIGTRLVSLIELAAVAIESIVPRQLAELRKPYIRNSWPGGEDEWRVFHRKILQTSAIDVFDSLCRARSNGRMSQNHSVQLDALLLQLAPLLPELEEHNVNVPQAVRQQVQTALEKGTT